MIPAILHRRSIRNYKDINVPQGAIEEILQAGILAPSSKNRQPWKFIVVSGSAKNDMLTTMELGLEREKNDPVLPSSKHHLNGAEYTVNIMRQAPVTIFVINTIGLSLHRSLSTEERIYEICNSQSIGASLENMTLTATELGLGSLWICDIFFMHSELCSWLNSDGELVAAMTLGYADENPLPRPRKKLTDIIEWRNEY